MTTNRDIAKARSQTYRVARDMGNVHAAVKGPGALSKRYVRKAAYRKSNRMLGMTLRSLGL